METVSLVLAVVLAGGCSGDDDPADTGVIGPGGGSLAGAGIALTIPAGALDADVEIGISDTGGDAPDGFTASSPIFRFTPDGLSFTVPIAVSIDFSGVADGIGVIWSLPSFAAASSAVAVIVCSPAESSSVLKLAPVPISPSMSDVQTSEAATSPSSASTAVAVKLTDVPSSASDASAGEVIMTTGGSSPCTS